VTARNRRNLAGGAPVTEVHNSIFFARAVPLVDVQIFWEILGVLDLSMNCASEARV
jgi:hypothetical protein